MLLFIHNWKSRLQRAAKAIRLRVCSGKFCIHPITSTNSELISKWKCASSLAALNAQNHHSLWHFRWFICDDRLWWQTLPSSIIYKLTFVLSQHAAVFHNSTYFVFGSCPSDGDWTDAPADGSERGSFIVYLWKIHICIIWPSQDKVSGKMEG